MAGRPWRGGGGSGTEPRGAAGTRGPLARPKLLRLGQLSDRLIEPARVPPSCSMPAAAVPVPGAVEPRTNMRWASRSQSTPGQLTHPLHRRMHSNVSAWTCHPANGLELQPARGPGRWSTARSIVLSSSHSAPGPAPSRRATVAAGSEPAVIIITTQAPPRFVHRTTPQPHSVVIFAPSRPFLFQHAVLSQARVPPTSVICQPPFIKLAPRAWRA